MIRHNSFISTSHYAFALGDINLQHALYIVSWCCRCDRDTSCNVAASIESKFYPPVSQNLVEPEASTLLQIRILRINIILPTRRTIDGVTSHPRKTTWARHEFYPIMIIAAGDILHYITWWAQRYLIEDFRVGAPPLLHVQMMSQCPTDRHIEIPNLNRQGRSQHFCNPGCKLFCLVGSKPRRIITKIEKIFLCKSESGTDALHMIHFSL